MGSLGRIRGRVSEFDGATDMLFYLCDSVFGEDVACKLSQPEQVEQVAALMGQVVEVEGRIWRYFHSWRPQVIDNITLIEPAKTGGDALAACGCLGPWDGDESSEDAIRRIRDEEAQRCRN